MPKTIDNTSSLATSPSRPTPETVLPNAEPVPPGDHRTSPSLEVILERHSRATLLILAALAAVVAWRLRFVQDDAYISFRYARNLVEGDGLVFQLGDRVQGFTNPLWTLLMTVPFLVGLDPVVFSQVVGIACIAATVVLSFHLAHHVLGTRTHALGAVLVLIGTVTFSSYGTGGLETPLQTLLVTAVALLTLKTIERRGTDPATLLAISVLAGAAMLTRLDSVLLVGTWMALLVFATRRNATRRKTSHSKSGSGNHANQPKGDRSVRDHAMGLALLVLPATVMVASWLAWAWIYYGSPLPNTFAAKSGGMTSVRFGFQYMALFVVSYGLLVLVPAIWNHGSKLGRSIRWRPVLIVVSVWVAYVVVVGGDFMEFRFLVPIMPLLASVIAYLLSEVNSRYRFVAIVVLATFSIAHIWTGPMLWISSFRELDSYVTSDSESLPSWSDVGRGLAVAFPGGTAAPDQVVLAVSAAGAIPYFSRLPTIDILGLNDAWVAKHGDRVDFRPGHLVRAPVDYLIRSDVNVIIDMVLLVRPGARRVYKPTDLRTMTLGHIHSIDQLPEGAKIIEVPVNDDRAVAGIMLQSNQRIDDAVAAGAVRVVPLVAE